MSSFAIAAYHAGVSLKAELVAELKKLGHEVNDLGPDSSASVDYPDYAAKLTALVTKGTPALGILICGTGIGMSIAANKVPGVRAAVVWNDKTAALAAEHNGANVLCLGGRVHSKAAIARMVAVWLATPFGEGRHARRLRKIARMEKGGDR